MADTLPSANQATSAPSMTFEKPAWNTHRASECYGLRRWGGKHFGIDRRGQVCVDPMADGRSIPIMEVLAEAEEKGLRAPMIVRFQDLLRHRVVQLNEAFRQAIAEEGYEAGYKGVFPIKVNQLREVVDEILDAGKPYHFGIEAGSKPELLIALAMHEDPESLIICNGYKDDDYVRLALLGRKLGKEVILVIEQASEVATIVRLAREMEVRPLLGFRVKLAASGEGKWAESSGEAAKFGLTSTDIVTAARRLKRAGLGDSLRLVHFHIGSQVPNIRTITAAVNEAARYYCELSQMGFPVQFLDVGGGLGIDYDGSRSNFESSMNYTMEEYARDVVFTVKKVCDAASVEVPCLVSESGRALVAAHSVLVVEVFDRIGRSHLEPPRKPARNKKRHPVLDDFAYIMKNPRSYSQLERYHDAVEKKEEALSLFSLGYLDLETRAEVEHAFAEVCTDIRKSLKQSGYHPEELQELNELLADQYVCNFSVFQSLLDHWACQQLFPIAPIHRLNEEPTANASLVDITCDSEGKIDQFIDLEEDANRTIALHEYDGKPYYLGIFMVGAYQDIMGDLHNLFGRTSEVHVFLEEDEEDGYYIEESIEAFKVKDILGFIQYRAADLNRLMKKQVDHAVREDAMKPREGVRMLELYDALLSGPTYLRPGKTQPLVAKKKTPRKKGAASNRLRP